MQVVCYLCACFILMYRCLNYGGEVWIESGIGSSNLKSPGLFKMLIVLVGSVDDHKMPTLNEN